jgi:CSLREA domain-containing protein
MAAIGLSVLGGASGLTPPPRAEAAGPFVVDSTADAVDATPGDGICADAGGDCTLRAAIQEANAIAGPDEITLPAGTYVLGIAGTDEDAAATGDLDVTDDVTLSGAGAGATVIDADGIDRLFHVVGFDPTMWIEDVTLTGGIRGALYTEGGLAVANSVVAGNTSGLWGIITNQGGDLLVIDSLISDNTTDFGAITSHFGTLEVDGTLITRNGRLSSLTGGIDAYQNETLIVDSTIEGNGFAPGGNGGSRYGGISNRGPSSMIISGSTIAGNRGSFAGGIYNLTYQSMDGSIQDQPLIVVNSTISGNTAGSNPGSKGGGIQLGGGELWISNSTVADNHASIGGGIAQELGMPIEIDNTIVWGNNAANGPDCFGTMKSLDYNLIGDSADCTLSGSASHDVIGANPLLGSLADNGGPTRTRALSAGSPAIDAGNPAVPGSSAAACSTVDQRGVNRPQGAFCDIGAFEQVPPPEYNGTFRDDDSSIFEPDIEWMAGEGITKGCNPPTNDMFCPNKSVTRAQMAAFLVRALDLTDTLEDPFTDDNGSIFEADIEKLAAAGITRGCNPPLNDMFCPDKKVTRGQMAAFLVRAIGYVDDGGGDLFDDDDESVFEGDIDRLGTAGVTRGCNPPLNTNYCPDKTVTRGQMAAFLHRALG